MAQVHGPIIATPPPGARRVDRSDPASRKGRALAVGATLALVAAIVLAALVAWWT